MPKNALAPEPTNALNRLLVESAAYPQYGELVGYLTSRRMLPPIEIRNLGNRTGVFKTNTFFGSELPPTGVVKVSPFAGPSTVVHELTHAAEQQLHSQAYELAQKQKNQKLTPLEDQFLGAYGKLLSSFQDMKSPRAQLAESLAPGFTKGAERSYRASDSEMSAFGMGSAVAPNTANPAPLHVDPTMATEFSILLDLASRLQQQTPSKGR